jgi:hypothetical protein
MAGTAQPSCVAPNAGRNEDPRGRDQGRAGRGDRGHRRRGNVVVRAPHRTRSGLNKAKVKDRMDPAEYAECETVTGYRTLLYGESDK